MFNFPLVIILCIFQIIYDSMQYLRMQLTMIIVIYFKSVVDFVVVAFFQIYASLMVYAIVLVKHD